MKSLALALFALALAALPAFAQTPAPASPTAASAVFTVTPVAPTLGAVSNFTLPGYVAGGLAFNQNSAAGTPRFNGWVSGTFPIATAVGVYESTTADVLPVSVINPANGRQIYTFSSSFREGVHKQIYAGAKVHLLLGGDIGGAFTTLPTGSTAATSSTSVSVNLSGSVTGTLIYQFNPHWAFIAPVRGLYTASISGWVLVPEIGLVWVH